MSNRQAYNVPDFKYGDYYCNICDAHMSSDVVWESHIVGKRHMKNILQGKIDSKYVELDVDSDIMYELKNVNDPVIGLCYIHEIRRKKVGFPPYYNCFLCAAVLPSVPLVIEHVLSMKHRWNYIKEKEPTEYQTLLSIYLSKDNLESLVRDVARTLEKKYGTGVVQVKQEKTKFDEMSYCFSDDDSDWDNYHREVVKKSKVGATKRSCAGNSAKAFANKKEKYEKREIYSSDDERFDKKHFKSSPRDKRDFSPSHYLHSYKSPRKRSESHDSRRRSHHHRDDCCLKRHSRSQKQVKERHSFTQSKPSECVSNASSPGPSGINLLPREMIKSKNFTDVSFIQDLFQKLREIPKEMCLKIFLHELENIDLKSKEEMTLVYKIIVQGNALLLKNLPDNMKEMVNLKSHNFASSGANDSTLVVPAQSSNTESNQIVRAQADISFITDMLNSIKSEQPSTSVSQTATQKLNAT